MDNLEFFLKSMATSITARAIRNTSARLGIFVPKATLLNPNPSFQDHATKRNDGKSMSSGSAAFLFKN